MIPNQSENSFYYYKKELKSPALINSQPFCAKMLYYDSRNRPAKATNQDLDFLPVLDFPEAFYDQPEWQGELECITSLTRLGSPWYRMCS